MKLSDLADNKANILITVNAIILSVVVSVLLRKIDENWWLMVPTFMLITSCLSAIVFAVRSTRPNIAKGKFTRDDIKNKKTNLLFFGNFHSMRLNDYEWAMKELMNSGDYLYSNLIKDIYFMGKVLGRKYKMLRISYNLFMYGLVVSVLAFLVMQALNQMGGLPNTGT